MSLSLIRKPFVIQGWFNSFIALMMSNSNIGTAIRQVHLQYLQAKVKTFRLLIAEFPHQHNKKRDFGNRYGAIAFM